MEESPSSPDTLDTDTTDHLFAILNLSRSCSQEEVQKSYKNLARLFHPDRHSSSSPELQSAAKVKFQEISRAFEVLNDISQRALYESLGEAGLTQKWDIEIKGKSAAELRAEFERNAKKKLGDEVENLVKSKADLTVAFDARVFFLPDQLRRDMGGPPNLSLFQKFDTIKTNRLFLKHSFTTPVSESTSVVITSQLLTRQGKGGGNVTASIIHRPNSKTSLEIGTTLLRPRALTFKATYAPNNDSFATFDVGLRTFNHPPPINVTIGQRVSEENTATVSIRTGVFSFGSWGKDFVEPTSNSTLSLGLINNNGWNIDATTGVEVAQLSLDYGRAVLAGSVDVRVGAVISSQGGFSTTLSGSKKVTENTRASLILELGQDGMMTFKIRLRRLGQSLVLPIIISSSLNSKLAISFSVLPALSMIAVNHYYLVPTRTKRVKSRILELRTENAEYIAEKKQEAEDAVLLLKDYVSKQIEIERNLNGVIILEAVYGILPSLTASASVEESNSRSLDVTIAVQALVQSSQLVIPGGRAKSNLIGFYDCAIGEEKRLRIRYTFKDRVHEVEVGDRDAVAIPLRSHCID